MRERAAVNSPRILLALHLSATAVLLGTSMLATNATAAKSGVEYAGPTALFKPNATEFLLAVHPIIAKLGQSRTVFVYQPPELCPGTGFALDTSFMKAQNLVLLRKGVRGGPTGGLCPAVPTPFREANFEFEFTPGDPGQLKVRVDPAGPEVTIQTTLIDVPSKFDVNGMWFDAATNGSGIALHHRRSVTDVAYGTWFLYSNIGESRWYTFQSANWQQDGTILEGLLYGVSGQCSNPSLVACPALGGVEKSANGSFPAAPLPSRARITFQSSIRGRAEVMSLGGAVLFTSELTKIQY
ncbi:MAG: hypothetical protein ABL931_02550 [Usitatibacteraceae bacterium]